MAGPGCVELARGIETALGTTKRLEYTPEYYQAAQIDQKVGTHG